MYKVKKRIEVAGSHSLVLNYDSPCSNTHGHNWIIEVVCEAPQLDDNGMVVDFALIKKVVNELDHTNLNEIFGKLGCNPTAENIAHHLATTIQVCLACKSNDARVTKVRVQESEGNSACYTP